MDGIIQKRKSPGAYRRLLSAGQSDSAQNSQPRTCHSLDGNNVEENLLPLIQAVHPALSTCLIARRHPCHHHPVG